MLLLRLTTLNPAFPLDMAVGSVLVVMVLARISDFCRVVEEHPASAMPDCFDEVNCKIRVLVEALTIRLDIALAARIHDLSCRDSGHQLPEGRP